MRKIIIGDIHGRYTAVQSILHKIGYDSSNSMLLFTGDYIDHLPLGDINVGNASAKETIDYLLTLKNARFLLGNHDKWFIDWINAKYSLALRIWYNQGGQETLESYGIVFGFMYNEVVDKIPQNHIDFMCSLEPVYIDEHIVAVHGGFSDKFDIDEAAKGVLTYEALWDRTFHKSPAAPDILEHYRKVFDDRLFVCGHSPWGPLYNDNHEVKRLLIDGGSGGRGYLYAAIVEGNQVKEIVKEGSVT